MKSTKWVILNVIFQEAEWIWPEQIEKQLAELELEHEQSVEEQDPLFCIPCDKAFMSIKS